MKNLQEQSSETQTNRLEKYLLDIKYPLSSAGIELLEKIKKGEANDEVVPTVENPRTELFADFEAPKEVVDKIFSDGLSNIQITKGCRHQCTFCAAGAAKTVQTMPFPAIIKAAVAKKDGEKKMREMCAEWLEDVQKETGMDIETLRYAQDGEMSLEKSNKIGRKVSSIFLDHPFRKFWETRHDYGRQIFASDLEITKGRPNAISFEAVPLGNFTSMLGHVYESQSVTNYYDSDPFDYKDRTFLHQDGSPADFGDVSRLLATKERPIHITTAGWSKTDTVAQRAAKKVVELGREFLSHPRLSINQHEVRARKNKKTYLEDAFNTIKTFEPVGLEVLVFDDKSDPEYTREVVNPIKAYLAKNRSDINYLVYYTEPQISLYSGPMKKTEFEDDHHDVMACMPGYHIWPDGSVAVQNEKVDILHAKGFRPTPNGQKLWNAK